MNNIIDKNILSFKLLDKLVYAKKNKRLFKSILRKIIPYLKGLFYFVTFKKEDFKLIVSNEAVNNTQDKELINRLFEFYKKMKQEQKNVHSLYKPSSLWQNHIDKDFYQLKLSIKENNFENFSKFIQNFGNTEYDLGILDHSSRSYQKNYFLKKFLINNLYNSQIKNWDYFNQKKYSYDALNMPKYGNLNGVFYKNNFFIYGAPINHIYAEIIKNYFNTGQKNNILEIGAGFGKLAYYYLKNQKKISFIDIDIPEVLLLASYYLIKSFPEKKFFLWGEKKFTQSVIDNYDLIFLPNWEIKNIEKNSINIVINKNSLGEIDPDAANNYIENIHRITKYFFSINHEFMRNEFNDNKFSLINKEYNLNNKFQELIRYPEIGHFVMNQNKIDYESDIFFYIYKKN